MSQKYKKILIDFLNWGINLDISKIKINIIDSSHPKQYGKFEINKEWLVEDLTRIK